MYLGLMLIEDTAMQTMMDVRATAAKYIWYVIQTQISTLG